MLAILPSVITADEGAKVSCALENGNVCVYLTAGSRPVSTVTLRWNFKAPRTENVKVFSDCWERGYGDLEWRGINPDRIMPWAFAVSNGSDQVRDYAGRVTECFGVKVRPGAIISWRYDTRGVTLICDVRCGGEGVILGGRTLRACECVFNEYRDMSAFEALNAYYKTLCDDPVFPESPVYGSNNWYYAYGKSSRAQIIRDAELIHDLCRDCGPRPYMVIDDGWTYDGDLYGDMATLAREIGARGCVPGIWIRFLNDDSHLESDATPDMLIKGQDKYHKTLDPSLESTLKMVARTMHTLTYDYGYKLIKHDYTNWDVFGRWGFECPKQITEGGWTFADRSRTSAEIMETLYKTIYEAAAPGTVIIGCNVAGFLSAGYCQINRTGDDTSGREWDRTRRMGVNTLAFRQMYEGAFYRADCDCVGIMGLFPWALNRKWMQLVAHSGTPLFMSIDPDVPDEGMLSELRAAYKAGTDAHSSAVPLDWMENTCPEKWLVDGEYTEFDWYTE